MGIVRGFACSLAGLARLGRLFGLGVEPSSWSPLAGGRADSMIFGLSMPAAKRAFLPRGSFGSSFAGAQDLHRTASLLDRGNGRLGCTPHHEIDLGLDFAAAEQLHAVAGAAQHAGLHQHIDVDRVLGIEGTGIDRRLDTVEIDLVQHQREGGVAGSRASAGDDAAASGRLRSP